MLLIGSRAAKFWAPGFREPKDWDLVGTRSELTELVLNPPSELRGFKFNKDGSKARLVFKDVEPIEFEIAENGNSSELFLHLNADAPEVLLRGYRLRVARLTSLFLIKKSHLWFPIHWRKSIEDYHSLKQLLSADFSKGELVAFRLRRKEIAARHKKKKINLNVSNEEFFGKSERAIGRTYDHDWLHSVTCFYDRPLYERCKYDLSKAKLDIDLFERLDYNDKLNLAREEIFVIALERKIIPGKITNPREALLWATEHIVTSLSKGWFREFCIENYPSIVDTKYDYVSKFYGACNV